jgi:endonuclease III
MINLSEVRYYAEKFVRMGLVKNEGGDYVPACTECIGYLDELLSDGRDGVLGFIAFMCLVHELLNDASIDTNMDAAHAELFLKYVLDAHEDAADAVNAVYEELAEKINAKGLGRARQVCDALLGGKFFG